MQRPFEYIRCTALLGHARCVHHVHAVGIARHDPQVVGDENERDPELAREILHELENLRLDRHIERGGRLVGNDKFGIARKGDRDDDALTHASRELVRVLLEALRGIRNAHEREQLYGTLARLLLGHSQVKTKRLHDLVADGEHRVQRRHRLLESHGDVASPDRAHVILGKL